MFYKNLFNIILIITQAERKTNPIDNWIRNVDGLEYEECKFFNIPRQIHLKTNEVWICFAEAKFIITANKVKP